MEAGSTSRAVAVGVDIGTSGVRAAALDRAGAVRGLAQSPFRGSEETRTPAAWWQGVSTCLRDLAASCDLSAVEGLAVDGTSGTVLAVDARGQPVGPVLMYNDPCPDAGVVEAVNAAAPAASPARGANSGLARAIHLSRQPGAVRVLHQADWILGQLGTDHPVSDENNALKTGYDLESECWPDWIENAGLDRGLLPAVVRAGTALGPVGGEALALGLPAACRLHAGTTDGCASFLATGAAKAGEAVTALGSTLVVKLASDRPVDAPQFGIYSHRVGSVWLAGGASNTGGAVVKALIGEERLAELTGRLDPDRPTGLDYYPLLKPGERFPINDPALSPRLEPRPADDAVFFQGLLEGMTAVERLAYHRLSELGAPRPTSVRTVGGGARNPVWTTLRERALGVPFLAARSVEAAVGTASLVLSALREGPR